MTEQEFSERILKAMENVDLTARSLLVIPRISMFRPSVRDKRLENDLRTSNGMEDGAPCRVWKDLLPEESIRPVTRYYSSVRSYIYSTTYPWTDARGVRMLPSKMLRDFMARMGEAERTLPMLAREHIDSKIDEIKATMQRKLGLAYDPNLYTQRYEDLVKVSVQTMPVPSTDIRVSCTFEQKKMLEESVAEMHKQIALDSTRELIQRLQGPISHMANKLRDEDGRIFKSVVENVRSIVDIAHNMNVLELPELTDVINSASVLCDHDADELKESLEIRDRVANAADEISRKLSGILY